MKKLINTVHTKMNSKRKVHSLFPVSLFPVPCSLTSRPGFSLVEMLVVIGIIAILVGASLAGFTSMTRSAEKAKCQELVSNVATALTAIYQREGNWPKRLAVNGGSDGTLDRDTALALARAGVFSLTTTGSGDSLRLAGTDSLGIVSPWAAQVIKRRGTSASLSDPVSNGRTVQDHLLHYAIDLDGDGVIKGASVGGQSVDIRATAAVWCAGKDGVMSPYPYAGGGSGGGGSNKGASTKGKLDDVYSWTAGQTRDVQ